MRDSIWGSVKGRFIRAMPRRSCFFAFSSTENACHSMARLSSPPTTVRSALFAPAPLTLLADTKVVEDLVQHLLGHCLPQDLAQGAKRPTDIESNKLK